MPIVRGAICGMNIRPVLVRPTGGNEFIVDE
jgi:hypothetical protein